MKTRLASIAPLFAFSALAALLHALPASASPEARSYLKDPQEGGLELRSAGKINFGPGGLLLVSDPRNASIVAVDTGDSGPLQRLGQRVDDIESLLAAALGAEKAIIVDMAVNPASGKIYFSVNQAPGNRPAILRLLPTGEVEPVALEGLAYVRVSLPASEEAPLRNVTDLAWGDRSVIVAGQSASEFANKIYQIPTPLAHGENAEVYSAETYHVAHRQWETKAPIQSFIPWEEDGKFYVVGAFACTPIAKFPLDDLASGAEVKGTSVVELGSGNRPRGMFIYESGGEEWLVTNTVRFRDNLFGPSKYWAARVKMDYLSLDDPEQTNENAIRRNLNAPSGPEAQGIEVYEPLFGAVNVSQLANAEVVVLRETDPDDEDAPHAVELVTLP